MHISITENPLIQQALKAKERLREFQKKEKAINAKKEDEEEKENEKRIKAVLSLKRNLDKTKLEITESAEKKFKFIIINNLSTIIIVKINLIELKINSF